MPMVIVLIIYESDDQKGSQYLGLNDYFDRHGCDYCCVSWSEVKMVLHWLKWYVEQLMANTLHISASEPEYYNQLWFILVLYM